MKYYGFETAFPKVIDNSCRSDWCSCPRMFYWRWILGLTPLGTNIHLNAGGAYADGLETFRKEFYGRGTSFEDARAMGVRDIIRAYGEPDFDPKEAKQWHNIVDAFLSYLQNWDPTYDRFRPMMVESKEGKMPAVEFSFALPINANNPDLVHPETDDPLLYHGRFDMLGYYGSSLFGLDDKTTGQLGPTWSQRWDLRSQFTGYAWGAREYGHDLQGFVIRGTAVLKTKINHAEAVVYRPQFMVNRWYQRLIVDSYDMLTAYDNLDNAPLDLLFPTYGEENDSCTSYGGCAFRMLCERPDPENWIEGNFVVDRWDPTRGTDQ